MPLEGDLQTFPLRELLGWLARSKATGTLSLARGMTTRRFHLRRGRVVLASSSEQEMLLGHLLLERGLVSAERLHAVLAGRGASRARLGRLLERDGLVSPTALRDVLTDKARLLLVDALDWPDGHFVFEARRPARSAGLSIAVALEPLLAAPGGHATIAVEDGDVLESQEAPA